MDNDMSDWESIIKHLGDATGDTFSLAGQSRLGGGSINSAYRFSGHDQAGNSRSYFVKTNRSGMHAMFEAEARGLNAMQGSHTVRVPRVICHGDDGDRSYLVLEYLALNGAADQAELGAQLAAMHRHTVKQFGWDIDNTIGSTPQRNHWDGSWLSFWREQRLGYQLTLAAQQGYGGDLQRLGDRLMDETPTILGERQVKPSMLHGDLWGGNVAALADGTPVIYDPAFYFGDRETDLAMTYVFGGFSGDFYSAYENHYPLDDGFSLRKTFYNLYHILNHLNLFGGGYHGQALNMMERVLAEVR